MLHYNRNVAKHVGIECGQYGDFGVNDRRGSELRRALAARIDRVE